MPESSPDGDHAFGRAVARPFRTTAADLRDPEKSRAQRLGIAAAVAFTILAIIPAALVLYLLLLIPGGPSAAELQRETETRPSLVLASDGTEIAQFERSGRMWVPLDSVAQPFIDALLATEDRRFFKHGGIDWRRSVGAALRSVGGDIEGGSTLSQQLARNLYPDEIGRRLTLNRKLREAITARRIEKGFSKEQILEAYVNTVPFLYNAFGVEMAARTYFGKSASELETIEAATLVGMLKGTSYYNPVRNPERAEQRRNTVLMLMTNAGVLDEAERLQLREQPLDIDFEHLDGPRSDHPHFTRYVREWLSEWADRNGYDLFADGLVVHTTLNPELQQIAEQAARQRGDVLQRAAEAEWADGSGSPMGAFWSRNPQFEERTLRTSTVFREMVAAGTSEAAALDSIRGNPALRDSVRGLKSRVEIGLVAIEPGNGHVRAWVGSRDFSRTPFDHVWQSRRQPGSAFKPFVFAAALQRGYLPGDTFVDERKALDVGHGQVWRPTNAGNRYTGGPLTLTEALAYSTNTVTAQLMMEVGPTNVVSVARNMGIRNSTLEPLPSLALGTSDVTLLELVSAFSTFASSGRYHEPIPVTRVETKEGRVVAEFSSAGEQAVPADVAQTVTHMLRGAIDRGTGRSIRGQYGITADVAGKTGTSQNGADGWFVLMHPHLVAGAWVGFPEPTMTWRTSTHGQGSRNALPIVGEFFRGAIGHIPDGRFETPARYREPGSIWERARRWWDDLFDESEVPDEYDDDFFRAELPYDDLSEWQLGDDTLRGVDDISDPIDFDDFDSDFDFDTDGPPEQDDPIDPIEPVDPIDPVEPVDPVDETVPPPDDDGQTAVQRLYDRLDEDLEDDLRDDDEVDG